MARLGEPRVWLLQARCDFAEGTRSQAKNAPECYRRYWYQQSYEKAIKAYAIASLNSSDPSVISGFRDIFLRHHAPLAIRRDQDADEVRERLKRAFPGTWQTVEKHIVNVRRMTEAFVNSLAHSRTIREIDSTRPSMSADAISYRYPFYTAPGDNKAIAPASWTGWTAYQGKESTVRDALDELLKKVGLQVGRYERYGRT